MKYALIGSGLTVENTAEAGENSGGWLSAVAGEYAHVIPLAGVDPEPGIGWEYDPAAGAFAAPPLPEVFTAPARTLTRIEFLRRVPLSVQIACKAAIAKAYVSSSTDAERQAGLTAEVIQDHFNAATNGIDLDDPMTTEGLQGLKALGLLTDAEIETILA